MNTTYHFYNLKLSQWLYARLRVIRIFLIAFTLFFITLSAFLLYNKSTETQFFSSTDFEDSTRPTLETLPIQIPRKLWQIYLSSGPATVPQSNLYSWISLSPSFAYTVVDAPGADHIVSQLASIDQYAHALPLFYAMTRRVMRADFLRYLLLAMEGGYYSDIDTVLLRPVSEWVPSEHLSHVRLVVALEVDSSPPAKGTIYEVQFCQWTLAAAKDHPILWNMIDNILGKMQDIVDSSKIADGTGLTNQQLYSDQDVLNITGPVGWTEVIYAHLSHVTNSSVTWKNLTGIQAPILFNDTLILPLVAFRSTFVKHLFSGSWKKGWKFSVL